MEKLTYIKLCKAIEETIGHSITTPKDFEQLADRIFSHQHTAISPSTLKRLWGYAGQECHPRLLTLDILARFIGYKDFSSFEKARPGDKEAQSQFFLSGMLTDKQIEKGACLQLSWRPDRLCVIEHLGEGRFRVLEAYNTKLSVGDTFVCHCFINREPLYINHLIHLGQAPICYVAGRKDGVTILQLLQGR